MREVFALSEKTRVRGRKDEVRKKTGARYRCFETFLRPPTVLEAQVKEPDLTPDDGQTPENDKSLLNDVWAGDPRYRLPFAIEPHGRERTVNGVFRQEAELG